jgi:hypothetical protein
MLALALAGSASGAEIAQRRTIAVKHASRLWRLTDG